jgi:uncharacterized protein
LKSIPVERVDHLPKPETWVAGTRRAFALHVARMADGTEISLPVNILIGKKKNPRLLMVAGVHGNEYEGITAQLELWQELDPVSLDGTIVMVPMANPPAFRTIRRRNPADEIDMNRIFPGDPEKSITHRLAYILFREALPGSNLLLSMHGWTSNGLILPYVEYPKGSEVTEASRQAALAFGVDYVEAFDWIPGLLVETACKIGIPSIEPEIGGANTSQPERRELYKRGTLNLLSLLGILPDTKSKPNVAREVTRTEITASVGGVFIQKVVVGEQVNEGQLLAQILDFHANPLAEIRAPRPGLVATINLHTAIEPGDPVTVLFHPLS